MTSLLKGELIKTVTTRTVFAFALGGIAFTVLNVLVVAVASGTLDDLPEKEEALSGMPILLLLWGLVGAAGEYKARAALVAGHRGATTLLARMVAYALTALVIGGLMVAVSVGLALPLLDGQPGADLTTGDVTAIAVSDLLAFVLSAIMGAAIGALIRSPVAGVVVLLIVNFAVVPLIAGAHESLANLTPFGAAGVLARMSHNTTLSVAAAGWVLLAWTLLFAIVALVGEQRRDLA
jgi:ABC-2 type transport system permease protein